MWIRVGLMIQTLNQMLHAEHENAIPLDNQKRHHGKMKKERHGNNEKWETKTKFEVFFLHHVQN